MRLLLASLLLPLIAVPHPSTGSPRGEAYGTRDVIVIGRIENLDYQLVYDPEDLLGHGWITARLHVARVLRGHVPSSVLSVRYFAHSYRYGEGDVRLHLRRRSKGTYFICADGGEGVRCR
ncbi:hypothetical protein [Sphingomonas sp.]|uniref:hypothetical protein n=1 Tax=Sphingomonas sp. TaxID=28214 RepID=UPI0025F1A84A|nr:hypothetical protein [Sphingomonas sp.]